MFALNGQKINLIFFCNCLVLNDRCQLKILLHLDILPNLYNRKIYGHFLKNLFRLCISKANHNKDYSVVKTYNGATRLFYLGEGIPNLIFHNFLRLQYRIRILY